jgi:hypothetical protein
MLGPRDTVRNGGARRVMTDNSERACGATSRSAVVTVHAALREEILEGELEQPSCPRFSWRSSSA